MLLFLFITTIFANVSRVLVLYYLTKGKQLSFQNNNYNYSCEVEGQYYVINGV